MAERIEPKLGTERFNCPHCGAFSHQNWYRLAMVGFDQGKLPSVVDHSDALEKRLLQIGDENAKKQTRAFMKRLKENALTYMRESDRFNWEFVNFWVSDCFSCKAFSVWVKDKLVYPTTQSVVEPHEHMPPSVKEDFEEAGSIVDRSPRGAAALARLCIQKLMTALSESGKDLNADIASLVKKGLEVEVQQALDVVRVIGNNAIHPGTIDLKDDKATALALLGLVNLIVERRIAAPEKLKKLFGGLPPGALEQIQKRDGDKK